MKRMRDCFARTDALRQLQPGETVLFTDMDHIRSVYRVMELKVLNPTAVLAMRESGYDCTLFTCTADMQQRFAVRCSRVS